jgi:predicted nucleic acid-binding protein
VPDLRVFLDANVLFTAAYSPNGLSALLMEIGAAGGLTLLTSQLAVIEARRNLEMKRSKALPGLDRYLRVVKVVTEPAPQDVGRLTPDTLSPNDRPILAAAIGAGAPHFVTGDRHDFGPWMRSRGRLPLLVMTPRQFLETVRP